VCQRGARRRLASVACAAQDAVQRDTLSLRERRSSRIEILDKGPPVASPVAIIARARVNCLGAARSNSLPSQPIVCKIIGAIIFGRRAGSAVELRHAWVIGRIRLQTFDAPNEVSYCFAATNVVVVPCTVSWTTIFMVLPSALTDMRATLTTFTPSLSVSWNVCLSMRWIETLVMPGSPP
jgi:hypothetical protein